MTSSRTSRTSPRTSSRTPHACDPPGSVALAAGRGGRLAPALALTLAVATAAPALPSTGPGAEPALTRVVVSAAGSGAAGVTVAAAAVRAAGGRVLDRLPLVSGVSAELPADAALAPGLVVAPDREIRVAQADEPPSGPAGTVRGTLGLGAPAGEGAGVTVAVVDTGVAPSPDLAGRLRSVDVTGTGTGDGYGHGTFVAGLVAGSGAQSGGTYAGVAPGARVLSVRVADDEGRTNLLTVLRGLEVARAERADVVNLSLSSYSPLPWQLDPLTLALGTLWRTGTVVVVPAGNDGPGAGTVTSPGVQPDVLTVGALDERGTSDRLDDVVADFSARGPAPQGVAKPELVAPGRSVVSLRAPGSWIDVRYGSTGAVGADYFTGSGTSFSTAVTAGAAAVLLAERDLTPDQVKALLTGTAYDAAGDPAGTGAGGLDLAAARAADTPDREPDRTTGRHVGQAPLPGSTGDWQPLVRALLRGDARAAARSWSRAPQEVRDWAASSWSALPADLRAELVAEWQGRNWGQALTAEQWAAIDWAGRNWAGRNWAASSWSGRNWGGRNWGGRNWGASSWSDVVADDWLDGWGGRNWAGRNWAGRNWAGRNWAGRNWGASSWSDADWAGRNWAGRNWADDVWAGRNWAASSWAGGSWAAAAWGA